MDIKPKSPWGYLQKKKSDKGYKHILNAFFEIMKRKDFLNDIQKLRKTYHIPDGGFSKTDHSEYLKWSRKYNEKFSKALFSETYKLCEKFSLPREWWKAVMEAIFHDSKDISDLGFGTTSGLCIIEDLGEKNSKDYPIAVKISPYASERDILEFIKLTYSYEIKTKQQKYKKENCLIGKAKSKNSTIQKRNNFIYKNRHLPLKEISTLLRENKFPCIDQGHISAVIHLEKKKRKDV